MRLGEVLKILRRTLFYSLLLMCIPVSAEITEVCGAFQSEDFGDRVIYMLTDFESVPLLPTYYSIQNPAVETGLSLLRGGCYCVRGQVKPDLEFAGDASYNVILLESLEGPPTFTCWPE